MKQSRNHPTNPDLKKKYRHSKAQAGRWFLICLFWLVLWQAGAQIVGNPLLLPSPWETLLALCGLIGQKSFYLNVLWTIFRCMLAMLLSFAAGACCAWLAYRRSWIRSLLAVPVSFFKAVPVMAIIIYVILLIRADWVAVPVCFLMCFPVVYTNLLGGLDAVPEELLEAANVYGLDSRQTGMLLYLPSLLTPIRTSLKLIAGLSWKAVVAAEVLAVPAYSLGYQMMHAKYYLETPQLFAYIAVIVTLSAGFEKLICRLAEPLAWNRYKGSRLRRWLMEAAPHSDSGGADFTAPEVQVQHVGKSFDGQVVLKDLTLHLEAGCVTALMGSSGAGKTTLARMLAGLTLPDSGTILLDGAYRLSFLFQEDRLLPWLNVYDNMALGFLDKRRRTLTGQEIDRRIRDLAEALELTDVLDKLPEELSGGMRSRAAMGRAFAAPSEFLILDEPFRGLDEELRARVIERLWKPETGGKTVLLITHRPEDSVQLAERKIAL